MNEKLNILVVDDELEICKLLRRILEKEGYGVSIASDGLQALDKLNNENFDLIVADVLMPNISGTVLLELLKQRGKDVPVILITGYPSDELEQYAQKAADAYLTKPFHIEQLRETVCRLIRKGSKELVFILLGLEFYASPEKAKLLKAKVTDLLLRDLSHEGLLGIDVRPAVDLTPTFTKIKKRLRDTRKKIPRVG